MIMYNNIYLKWVDVYASVAYTVSFIIFILFYLKVWKQRIQLSVQLKVSIFLSFMVHCLLLINF